MLYLPYSAEKAHKRMRETVQTTNSSVVVNRSLSFFADGAIIRGGRINEVKRPVQELGG